MIGAIKGTVEVIRLLNRPCRHNSVLISRDTDGEVGRATRIGLRLHYVLCKGCRRFAAQLRALRRVARRITPEAAERALASSRMPSDVRARILARLGG